MKTFTINNYFERDIPIDAGVGSEATGERLPIRVRRFTVAQLQLFMRGWDLIVNPAADRFIFRKTDGDEQALRDDGRTYLVPAAEVTRRRLLEMSQAEREAYDQAKRADDEHLHQFALEQIAAHVWPAPGVVLNVEDDSTGESRRVTDGKGLIDAFGGNLSMLMLLTSVIFEENTLTAEKKRQLRLRSAFTTGSPASGAAAAAAGPTPEPTAASAASSVSAASGDASADPVPSPCGSTRLTA